MAPKKVLVPLDGSEFSRQILAYLPKFFDPETYKIIFLRVDNESARGLVPAPPVRVANEWPRSAYVSHRDAKLAKHPIYANQVRDSRQASLEAELHHIAHDLREAGYDISVVVKFGDPAPMILDFIEQEKIDLIAMTTHGRTGLGRMIFGSVAEKVLHKISVPVLLLRPTKKSSPLETQKMANGVDSG